MVAQEARSATVPGDNSKAPPDELVRASVERILASPDFVASSRSSEFLKHIVEETLSGRADRIKAFSIAVEVLGRGDDFDSQNDPVVRIEAGRLRRKLQHYYLLHGKSDPIVITVPKGGYVPRFEWNTADSPAEGDGSPDISHAPGRRPPWRKRGVVAAAVVLLLVAGLYVAITRPFQPSPSVPLAGPRIVVLPFTDLGNGSTSALYAAALIDDIITHLGRYREITVLGAQTSRAAGADADPAQLHRDLAVQYVLEGSVRLENERARVTARLVTADDGAVLWSTSYSDLLEPDRLIEIQVKTAEEVATALAEPYGIIFREELNQAPQRSSGDLSAYLCTLSYYQYRAAASVEQHGEVRDCLEAAATRYPDNAVVRALLGYLYIDEDRYGFNPRPEPRLRALEVAREAVRLDPRNIRALQALMLALFFNQQADEALRMGEQATDLNPSDPELLGQLGLMNAMGGSAEDGRSLLEEALSRNPAHAGYYHGLLAMAAYVSGDYERAMLEIEQVDHRKVPVYPRLVAAMIYAQAGRDEQARAELAEFQRLAPGFIPNLWAELDKRNFAPDRQRRIVDGLQKAGATIPPKPTPAGQAAVAID